ncbi:hypothetical protein B0E53_01544 [Micromonospora sp. MH33]|nr:hypothetical protein B0E53_01544 [Micromonospora sp. MH33]
MDLRVRDPGQRAGGPHQLGPAEQQHQHRAAEPGQGEAERVDGLRGGVVQVVHDHHQRRLDGERAEQVGDRVGHRLGVRRRGGGVPLAVLGGGGEFGVPEQRQELVHGERGQVAGEPAEALPEPAQPLLDGRPGERRGGVVGQADRRPDQVGEGGEPAPLAERGAADGEDPGAGVRGVPAGADVVAGGEALHLGGEPGLADPRLGGHQQHPRLAPVDHLGEPAGDPADLGLPAHEGRLVAEAGPGARRVQQAEQLVRLDRLALALEPQRAQRPPGGDVPGGG